MQAGRNQDRMDLGRSLAFPFTSPSWVVRTLVGAALELLPALFALPIALDLLLHRHPPSLAHLSLLAPAVLVSLVCRWIVLGYLRRVACVALTDTTGGLPPWDRFADDLVEGFKLWLVLLVLILPVLLIPGVLWFLMAAIGMKPLAWAVAIMLLPVAALAFLLLAPAALITAIGDNDIAAAFDLPRVTATIGACFGPYVLAFLLALVAEISAQLGLVLFCVGILATRFLAHCIVVHAFASVIREGRASLAAPVATA